MNTNWRFWTKLGRHLQVAACREQELSPVFHRGGSVPGRRRAGRSSMPANTEHRRRFQVRNHGYAGAEAAGGRDAKSKAPGVHLRRVSGPAPHCRHECVRRDFSLLLQTDDDLPVVSWPMLLSQFGSSANVVSGGARKPTRLERWVAFLADAIAHALRHRHDPLSLRCL